MARQLQQQGKEMALLALLDSFAPGTLPQNLSNEDVALFIEAAQYIGAAIGRPITLTPSELYGLSEDARVDYLARQMRKVGLLPQASDNRQVRGLLPVFSTNMQMRYHPPTQINVPTVLFRAGNVKYQLLPLPDATLGWQAFITAPVETYTLAGDHFSMLSDPHVQTLAAHLQTQLHLVAARVSVVPEPSKSSVDPQPGRALCQPASSAQPHVQVLAKRLSECLAPRPRCTTVEKSGGGIKDVISNRYCRCDRWRVIQKRQNLPRK